MPLHMAELVEEALAKAGKPVSGSRIAVLGVAYLENADDTRNTPAAPLIKALQELGADVIAHDPFVRQADFDTLGLGLETILTQDLEEALMNAECAAIVTKHRDYLGSKLLQTVRLMNTPILVDGRGCIDKKACAEAGIAYLGLGRGVSSE